MPELLYMQEVAFHIWLCDAMLGAPRRNLMCCGGTSTLVKAEACHNGDKACCDTPVACSRTGDLGHGHSRDAASWYHRKA